MSDDVTAHVTVNGKAATRIHIHVPGVGPWFADVDFADAADGLAGAATIVVGDVTLTGTFAPQNGTFGLQRKARILAGGGGWGHAIPAKSYPNDAGVKALLVAREAAAACGERLAPDAVTATNTVGASHFVREAGSASKAIEAAAGGFPWWVDYTGVTHIAESRTAPAPAADSYVVLEHNPRQASAVIAVDSLAAIAVGATLTERLDAPLKVVALEFDVSVTGIRCRVWGDTDGSRGAIADSLEAIIDHVGGRRLDGIYRYRAVRMAGDRVDLQVVKKASGLPDVVRVPMMPGVSGAHVTLKPGCICYVQFVDGDRGDPVITSFSGKGDPSDIPDRIDLAGGRAAVARQGDLVQCGGVGTMVTFGTIPPTPPGPGAVMVQNVPYLISFSPNPLDVGPLQKPLYGVVATGSPKVHSS